MTKERSKGMGIPRSIYISHQTADDLKYIRARLVDGDRMPSVSGVFGEAVARWRKSIETNERKAAK